MKLTRWSQQVTSIWVGRCVQQPLFEEVTEESLENFVNKYVKRLGLWSDTTIHHETFNKWMVCIVSLDLLVKMTSKCTKHQPNGLLQSSIFHTNLWEKYLLEILKCVVTTIGGSRGYSDVAFFRRWVFISPLVFEIVMKFIRYGALSTTGISIRGWIFFKDNEGNALNV